MPTPRRLAAVVLALLTVGVWPSTPTARSDDEPGPPASDEDRARALFERANTSYNLGRFDAAIADFEDAYKISHQPDLLYNIAQAHRLAGRCREALHFYRTYARIDPRGARRQGVAAQITKMEACVARGEGERTGPPAGGPVVPDAGDGSAPTAATARPGDRTPGGARAGARRGRGLRIAGWAVAGAGAALVGTGGLLSLRAGRLADDVAAGCAAGCLWGASPTLLEADSDGQAAERTATVLYAAGGAALVGGAALYLIGRAGGAEPHGVTVAPAPGGGAVLSWSGRLP